MDGTDLRVRLCREEREEVVGSLAFLDLPDGRPGGPDAGEAGACKRAMSTIRKWMRDLCFRCCAINWLSMTRITMLTSMV